MYGMIHRAIHDFLSNELSAEEWPIVRGRLGLSNESLISAIVYPDSQTNTLVKSSADLLQISTSSFLQRFGRFWISFSKKGSYRHILEFTGQDLASFVSNLDRMHQAVLPSMPAAKIPSFHLAESRPGILVVHYLSDREGLEPFVIGLLEGLLCHFGHDGSVEYLEGTTKPAKFIVRYEKWR